MDRDPRLLGKWSANLSDPDTLRKYGHTSIAFGQDGKLIYAVPLGERHQIILLEYSADGRIITTNQPSSPREERTSYEFTLEGHLVLHFGGVRSCFTKVSELL